MKGLKNIGGRLRVAESKKDANRWVADDLVTLMAEKPDAVLGLATGGTPQGLYEELIRRHNHDQLDFSSVTTFNLDEYVGLAPDHPQSFNATMRCGLFDALELRPSQSHLPTGIADDFVEVADDYERAIATAGGIDWQLLGIGDNGHIAFNEPGSPGDSRTRLVELTEETIAANARFFESADEVPRQAITMGIGTILKARRIILMAFGESKADAVAAAVTGPVTPDCPASFLQRHPDVVFVTDQEAAAKITSQMEEA